MPAWVTDQPFAIAFAILFGIVFARAQATYWAGRGANAGGRRTRLAARLEGERMARATDAVTRWGWPLITVSFLTVGFQTVANAAAGVVRMPWPKYTLAMIPGCLAWAAVYATIGAAASGLWAALAEQADWAPWAVVAVLVAAVIAMVVLRRHRRRFPEPTTDARGSA